MRFLWPLSRWIVKIVFDRYFNKEMATENSKWSDKSDRFGWIDENKCGKSMGRKCERESQRGFVFHSLDLRVCESVSSHFLDQLIIAVVLHRHRKCLMPFLLLFSQSRSFSNTHTHALVHICHTFIKIGKYNMKMCWFNHHRTFMRASNANALSSFVILSITNARRPQNNARNLGCVNSSLLHPNNDRTWIAPLSILNFLQFYRLFLSLFTLFLLLFYTEISPLHLQTSKGKWHRAIKMFIFTRLFAAFILSLHKYASLCLLFIRL